MNNQMTRFKGLRYLFILILAAATLPADAQVIKLQTESSFKDADGNGALSVGDKLDYTLTATNDWIFTVENVVIEVSDFGLNLTRISNPKAPTKLDFWTTEVWLLDYTFSQEDIDSIYNSGDFEISLKVQARGQNFWGLQVSAPETMKISVPPPPTAALQIVSMTGGPSADANKDGTLSPGDDIRSSVVVENTGGVTLYAVSVKVDGVGNFGTTRVKVDPALVANMPPGTKTTFTVTKELTAQDILTTFFDEAMILQAANNNNVDLTGTSAADVGGLIPGDSQNAVATNSGLTIPNTKRVSVKVHATATGPNSVDVTTAQKEEDSTITLEWDVWWIIVLCQLFFWC